MKNLTEAQRYAQAREMLLSNGRPIYAGTFLHHAAQLYPERLAIIFKEERYTYAQLGRWAQQCAYQFRAQGLKPKKSVLICLHNCPAYYAAYFGAWHSGAIVAPLNTFLGPIETKHIVDDAQPTIIVTESSRIQQFKD